MRHLLPFLLLLSCLATFLPGCEPKEELVQTSGSLTLKQDTVLFDTVFTTVRTVTKRYWVYNENRGAVRTDISLAGDAGATYSLIINGDNGPSASNVLIRGNDSLQILVRATLGATNVDTAFVVSDRLRFVTNGREQTARLVAYGQNAYFHRGVLNCNEIWRNDKPHVLLSSVLVPPGCALNILPGTQVYLHAGVGIIVQGRLLINQTFRPGTGLTDTIKANDPNIVRFRGDRREAEYNDVPGQWAGILIDSCSRGNVIRYTEIKNATFGLLLRNPGNNAAQPPSVTLENSVLRNISGSQLSFSNQQSGTGGGIISLSGQVAATNCLFTNCGEYAVLGLGGGTFDLNFCTIANYTPSFRRETASLTFTNELANGSRAKAPLRVTLRNSILWGSIEDELFLENNADPNYVVDIRNSLLRTKEYAATADAAGKPGLAAPARGNLVNQDPKFRATPFTPGKKPDYSLDAGSPALDRPNPYLSVPLRDLRNLPRSPATPDLGAYERGQ